MRRTCVAIAVVGLLAGCKGSGQVGSIAALGTDALVEQSDTAKIGWSVDRDDHVRVAVESPDGKPIGSSATGTLVYKTPDGASKTVPLTVDAKTQQLVAAGPALSPGLTEVDYTLNVQGKPASGTLYVPPGGTAAIVAEAKASGDAGVALEGVRGPHGGVVQLVGGDRLEIASTHGGEVHVYVLDASLHPIAIGARTIVLGVVGDRPEVVKLEADPSGRFFVGHWHLHAEPVHITVNETIGGEEHVALVGYRPGAVLVIGPAAPAAKVVVLDKWDDDVPGGSEVVVAHGQGELGEHGEHGEHEENGEHGEHGDHGHGHGGGGGGGGGGVGGGGGGGAGGGVNVQVNVNGKGGGAKVKAH